MGGMALSLSGDQSNLPALVLSKVGSHSHLRALEPSKCGNCSILRVLALSKGEHYRILRALGLLSGNYSETLVLSSGIYTVPYVQHIEESMKKLLYFASIGTS